MAVGKKSPQGDESRMRHPSWSQGRVLGLGVVRLLVHGWVAQDSVQRSEDMGRSIGTPWDTQGCGQGEEHQWVLSGCRMPKPHSRGQAGTHVMGRRQVITSRNIISGRPRECTCLAPGEGWSSGIHIFLAPQGGRGVKRLTLLAVSLGIHHHHHGEHHAAG